MNSLFCAVLLQGFVTVFGVGPDSVAPTTTDSVVSETHDVYLKYSLQFPAENRTHWVKPDHPYLRLFYIFTVTGERCPKAGAFLLDFYDESGSAFVSQVRQDWVRDNLTVVSGELSVGRYKIIPSLEFVPINAEDSRKPLVFQASAPIYFSVNTTTRRIKRHAVAVDERQKDFIYLVQHHEYMDLSEMKGLESDALLLVWKVKPPEDKIYPRGDAIWRPKISLTEGRNELVEVARQGNFSDYMYYILRDGDMQLKEIRDFGKNNGHPFRTFERYLKEWEPAVGYVKYDHHQYDENLEVQLGYNYDAIIVAYHAETLGVLMPYTLRYIKESWHHCARVASLLSALLYNEHRIQFNALQAINSKHNEYPAFGGYQKPLLHVLGAVANMTQYENLWFNWIDSNRERWGTPKKKGDTISYYVNATTINPCHDLFRLNPYFKETYPELVTAFNDARCRIDSDLTLVHAMGLLQSTRTRLESVETKVDQLQSLFRHVLKQMSDTRERDTNTNTKRQNNH